MQELSRRTWEVNSKSNVVLGVKTIGMIIIGKNGV